MVVLAFTGLFAPATVTGATKSNGAAPSHGYTATSASLAARATVQNTGTTAATSVTVRFDLYDSVQSYGDTSDTASTNNTLEGEAAASGNALMLAKTAHAAIVASTTTAAAVDIPAGGTMELSAAVPVDTPQLWSIPRPYLYTLTATVLVGTQVVDSFNISVGIYSSEWTADTGFYMNAKPVKVRGFCDHNDFGGVGMASEKKKRINLLTKSARGHWTS